MRFHVLGIGSIGSLVSFHLRRALPTQHEVCLISRRVPGSKTSSARTSAQQIQSVTVESNGTRAKISGFKTEQNDIVKSIVVDLMHRSKMLGSDGYSRHRALANSVGPERLPALVPSKPTTIAEAQNEARHSVPKIDSLIVATKAIHVLQALRECKDRIHPGTTIVLLQNGMGIYESVIHHLYPDPETRPHFIIATTTHGAWKKAEIKTSHHVVHSGHGELVFGIVPDPRHNPRDFERTFWGDSSAWNQRLLAVDDIDTSENAENPLSGSRYRTLRATVSALLSMDLAVRWVPTSDLQIRLRQKLAVNCSVNPLTAILGCRNGDLYISKPAHKTIRAICEEASNVYQAATAAAASLDDQLLGGGIADNGGLQRLSGEMLTAETMRVIKATSANWSSMQLDMERGNELEIEYMNGYLEKLGEKHGVPTPTTSALKNTVLVKAGLRRFGQLV